MTLAPLVPLAVAAGVAGAGAAAIVSGRRGGLPRLAGLPAWRDRLRQRAALGALDDRLLRDVGIGRAEAEREARRLD